MGFTGVAQAAIGGCGSSDDDGLGSSGNASGKTDCASACGKVGGVGCPNDLSFDQCVADCEAVDAQCSSQAAAAAACLTNSATLSCNASGRVAATGCDGSFQALGICSACVARPSDTSCTSCARTKCCAEGKDLTEAPNAVGFAQCMGGCFTSACANSCVDQFPGVKTAYQAYLGCLVTNCAGQC